MTDPRVSSICEEYGIRVIAGNKYPDVGETRAISTLHRILKKYGEEHFRDVLNTAATTDNNKASLEANFLWCCSDLLIEYRALYDLSATRWLAVFDRAPISQFLWLIRGKHQQRFLLKGFLIERIVRAFAEQFDMFQGGHRMIPTLEMVEAAAIALRDDGCGAFIEGSPAFCDDQRLPEEVRHGECLCKSQASLALNAAFAHLPEVIA